MQNGNQKKQVMKIRNFRWLSSASGISYFGNGMQFIANGWIALKWTGEAMAVGWVFALGMIPNMILAPFLGLIIDRFDKRLLMLLVDILRAVLLTSICLLTMAGHTNIYFLYIATFLTALGDGIYYAASPALVREIIPKPLLLPGNSAIATRNQSGTLLGAGAAGLLLLLSDSVIFGVNALTFMCSAYCIYQIKHRSSIQQGNSSRERFSFKGIWAGYQYLREHKQALMLYGIILGFNFTLRCMNVLLSPFVVTELKSGVVAFSIIDAAFAIGAIIGNIYLVRLIKKFGYGRLITGNITILVMLLVLFSSIPVVAVSILVYLLFGAVYQTRVTLVTLSQQWVEGNVMGRVQAALFMVDCFLAFLSYLFIGYMSDHISPKWLYIAPATALCIVFIVAFRLFRTSNASKHDQTAA